MRTLLVARVRPRLAALLLAAAGAFPACTPDSIPGESTARESSSPIASRLRGVRSSAMQCLDCGSGYCGDGFCDEAGGESCDFCPEDCGTCSPPPPPPPSTCNGTAGMWSGCRGNGCAVCQEKVAGFPCYFQNHPACALNTTCAGLFYTCNAACPQPTDADRCCTTDTCDRCAAPFAYDADGDRVPDQLELDLAYRFFPEILLQNTVPDLNQLYSYQGKYMPFTATPIQRPGTICEEDLNCIELRYGIAYDNDCGDFLPWESRDHCDNTSGVVNKGHPGDSEFFAAVVVRKAPWSLAQSDASQWVMFRDFTAAHWRAPDAESSAYGARGYCPSGCAGLTEPSCNNRQMCYWYRGFCTGTPQPYPGECSSMDQGICLNNQDCIWSAGHCQARPSGGSCAGYPQDQCTNTPGCQWDPARCVNGIYCDSPVPSPTNQTYYASEGKHALYHSDAECDAGGFFWADNCGSSAYPTRAYTVNRRLLQNVGQPDAHNGFDTTIDEPNATCGVNDVWTSPYFGSPDASPYSSHFRYFFGWVLPPRPYCGDGRCDVNERCHDVFAGSGCGDCGNCPYCGDGRCNGGETEATCPADCTPECAGGYCRDGTCCPARGVCSDGSRCLL